MRRQTANLRSGNTSGTKRGGEVSELPTAELRERQASEQDERSDENGNR